MVLFCLTVLLGAAFRIIEAASLPIVDLGYELHQASSFNNEHGWYNFSNIRYAAPPLGQLRFRPPVPPMTDRSEIQTGNVGRVCPQVEMPQWATTAYAFIVKTLYGYTLNASDSEFSIINGPGVHDGRITEDCLFLDVIVPKKIYERRRQNCTTKALAPVLVSIYGGGYVMGDKNTIDPTGLMKRSMQEDDGFIWVSFNYRVGAFGWLASDATTEHGVANAGLHDQRLALEWVQNNIHLFGGDANQVTVIGQSAGGGSIIHQIVAYGGSVPGTFQKAIVQSPGLSFTTGEQQNETANQLLRILNVSSIEEARQLPTESLIAANSYQITNLSTFGSFSYGPVTDGRFAPDIPARLLTDGRFNKNIRLIVGHNADEGLFITAPETSNSSVLTTLVGEAFPNFGSNLTNHITNNLYPPVYNGSYGYNSPLWRADLLFSEAYFTCSTNALSRALPNQTYPYIFSVYPALHSMDSSYVWYDGSSSAVGNATIAYIMQDYIVNFIKGGTPLSTIGPPFRPWSVSGSVLDINTSGVTEMKDPTDNDHCRFWQRAPY
ncbi:carboxylesterase family protein [Aspergillus fischeri NRRL 181]|uniref:Carboxylic ester hydrolase n=1 Tax=Neosartorya fischeri (strain ATCC 1020 / DSM 3700 / CBS 544.65 / FGSC A1164 / JCM 1740 / NRRL 181 / WB 181) TaxID=331117 RepID=A1DC27_NEOFI|nr:carboxylesterase family protein [Aspergillus fischeri NRRL 181]EAW20417.1 carboxylesterase family protein [Aspergillus fischeri NRRL 181]KAG2000764.1 hypothetical protein GB937_010861 [Aspergillus fischeri]